MRRLPLCLLLALSLLALALLLAPVAEAHNDGRGFYGATNDKVITNAGFILIAFFPLLVATLSFVQWRLDKRKHARLAAQRARRARAEWRGGW